MKLIKAFAQSNKSIFVGAKSCSVEVTLDRFEDNDFGSRTARSATVSFLTQPALHRRFTALDADPLPQPKPEIVLSFSGDIPEVESALFAYFGDVVTTQVLEG